MPTFLLRTKIIYGPGSVNQLGEEAKRIGRKAMIVTYPDIRRVGLLDKVVENLKSSGVDTLIFEEVEPNPRSSTVDKGAKIARDEKIDLIIGLGGGSAMDTAKGIALASSGTEPIWSYVIGSVKATGPVPPLIQIPTMAGTGSEANPGGVITNWETHDKRTVASGALWAKVAIVDPEMTLTLPRKQTAAGGVDTFCHAVEDYVIESPNPLTDGIRETVMKMVVKYLPQVLARLDDIEARTQLSMASTVAMSSIATLGSGLGTPHGCHGIEHALGGYYDVTHGEGLAALLPAWMRHSPAVRKERLDALGKNVFGKADGLLATEEWLESVGMRLRLRDLGCEFERAEEMAKLALKSNPRLIETPDTIVQIYKDSY
ncbi:iron-containing alcohol dehydrogenase [Chloroflexota bacterium]